MQRTTFLFASVLATSIALVACGDDSAPATASSGSGGSGGESGSGGAATSTPTSAAATTSATTAASTTDASSSASSADSSSSSSDASSSSTGEGGAGSSSSGEGGSGQGGAAGWPACLVENFGGSNRTIADVWSDDPLGSTAYWIPDVVVTGVSDGGCSDGDFCQIFVQQEETFDDLADGAQQAIRVLVAPEVAFRFEGVVVGDRVDLGGEAYRDTTDDRNELRFFVRESAPGCMDVVGSAAPAPVDVVLGDLTQEAYEETVGPLLVKLTTVSGRPHQPAQIFALWDTEEGPDDGGIETVTNMSPTLVPGSVFVALVPEQIVDFGSVTGVYGQFYRDDNGTKYETLYIRSMGDAPFVD